MWTDGAGRSPSWPKSGAGSGVGRAGQSAAVVGLDLISEVTRHLNPPPLAVAPTNDAALLACPPTDPLPISIRHWYCRFLTFVTSHARSE